MRRSSQKKTYVTFIAHQPKNPPTVDRLTNQLNTAAAPALTFMNARSEKQLAASTATSGSPFFVQYAKTLGACPRSASP